MMDFYIDDGEVGFHENFGHLLLVVMFTCSKSTIGTVWNEICNEMKIVTYEICSKLTVKTPE